MRYCAHAYDLRWRFEYKDRAPVYGIWTSDGLAAWKQKQEGLVVAVVEARNRSTYEVKPVAVCAGEDFIEFRWIYAGAVPVFALGSGYQIDGVVHGITLVSRQTLAHFYLDGIAKTEPNNEPAVISHAWSV